MERNSETTKSPSLLVQKKVQPESQRHKWGSQHHMDIESESLAKSVRVLFAASLPQDSDSPPWLYNATSWTNCKIPRPHPQMEKEMSTHSSVLAWRILGIAEPGGLPSTGSHRVSRTQLKWLSSSSSSTHRNSIWIHCWRANILALKLIKHCLTHTGRPVSFCWIQNLMSANK